MQFPLNSGEGELAQLTKPRICMISGRNYNRKAYQCGLYEAQDVMSQVDDVDLFCLEPATAFRFREKLVKRFLWHDYSGKISFVNPGIQPVFLKNNYDLFISVCQNFWDLLYVNAIKGWKDLCSVSVCWIDEVWANDVREYRHWFPVLKKFDHVVVSLKGSVSAVSDAIERPCHYVPGGVDVLRFSPYPNPPSRVIDVYSIGRNYEGVHNSLLELARNGNIFYVHDTFRGAMGEVIDIGQHREMLANMTKRSRYFIAWPAKMDLRNENQGQIEVGYRYFEGAAAGAVLMGQIPKCESFPEMFNWQDPVIEIQPDGSDVPDVLSRLAEQPERIHAISRRNAKGALMRLDWAYRWKEIMNIAGIKPSRKLEEREAFMEELARQIE
jgi:Glycosyl transferases group 1